MGRHSAADDEADVAAAVDKRPGPTGAELPARHARPAAGRTGPQAGVSPPEQPGERTSQIPVVEADLAAGADSELAPLVDVPAAELVPILPGEAVAPPRAGQLEELDSMLAPDPAQPDSASGPVAVDPVEEHAATSEPDSSGTRPPKETLLHRGAHASAADVALLRSNGSLRTRCVAAFLAPFVVYAVVLIVIGAAGRDYLLWIWVPTIIGCVAFGSLLDAAHRTVEGHPDGDGDPDGRLSGS